MSNDTTDPFVAHAHRRVAPKLAWLKSLCARSTAAERLAWHTGELVHRRTAPLAADDRPVSVDVSGMYTGASVPSYPSRVADRPPSSFSPAPGGVNPVLTADDVTDFGSTDCVADPFLFVTEDGRWHLFFEVYNNRREPTAAIAHAESPDGYEWEYDRLVLETDEHLSFPYVFRWDDEYYMVPDRWAKTGDPAGVTLYRATTFPRAWTPVADLVEPSVPLHDFAPFRWRDRWWALLGDGTDLYAYYADALETEGWTPHEDNPVVTDRPSAARPGGRPLVFDDHVLAFFQDCGVRYGDKTRAYEITDLTPTSYADRERGDSPILAGTGGRGWNSGVMHQIDPWYDGEGWHCAVDGNVGLGYQLFGEHHWAIGIYRA